MSQQGYYRFPTIHKDKIIFVCESDLWFLNTKEGISRRLTSNLGWVSSPKFSPDGKIIAFTALEEGHPEVYTMPSIGGPIKRLTFLGSSTSVIGWSKNGKDILFKSNYGKPHAGQTSIYTISVNGGIFEELPFGICTDICYSENSIILGRLTGDPARWKRYRGGRAGVLLIKNNKNFSPLILLKGNLSSPMSIGDRIYFLSDHEGIANIYSCNRKGEEITKHTNHKEFYARNPSTDGRQIIYHAGAEIFVLDTDKNREEKIEFDFTTSRTQTTRKFVSPITYLEDYSLHPDGHSLLLTSRGKPFDMYHWTGTVKQKGIKDGVRYRLTTHFPDGKRFICLSDSDGKEIIEIHNLEKPEKIKRLKYIDFGRPINLQLHPSKDFAALTNNRGELIVINLKTSNSKVVDKSEYGMFGGFNWSPDGEWIVYSIRTDEKTFTLRIQNNKSGAIKDVTSGEFMDMEPVFDPDGKYLYFLSFRTFNPVMDYMTFDYNFSRGLKPYVVTLRKDLQSPFISEPYGPGQIPPSDKKDEKKDKKKKTVKMKIDFTGIKDRILEFPVNEGQYYGLSALPGGRVLFIHFPIEGRLNTNWFTVKKQSTNNLIMYTMSEKKKEIISAGVNSYDLSHNKLTICLKIGNKLRVLKAGEKTDPKTASEGPSKKSGWIDLNRIKLSINPTAEWQQMYMEAWRLQKENFWTENMSGVKWDKIKNQYYNLIPRIGSRGEFSDLLWEMQGELATSHAYEFGGDYRTPPRYIIGQLGADFKWDKKAKAYKITNIIKGDSWNIKSSSPLMAPGLNISENDYLISINGQKLDENLTPQELLVNLAAQEIEIAVKDDKKKLKTHTVKTMVSELRARYRNWVNSNREYVHKKSRGKIGYIHIPDCSAFGYSEFHRSYIKEFNKEGLIIDVRYNGGGHVSPLLLEKLARRKIAYNNPRWSKPEGYPNSSPNGPMVALTNEGAGSDGDIFSHCFKIMKLGPLIGKRTWGGVIGITMRDSLVDKTLTTQPQFSFWFKDVGWEVENYGTEPDIEVDITPEDYAAGLDPQLDRSITEVKKIMKSSPPSIPDFGNRPYCGKPGEEIENGEW